MSVIAKSAEIHVLVRVTPSGAWIVHDEIERRGGRFRDRHAALRFIRREFGLRTRVIMQATLPRQAA